MATWYVNSAAAGTGAGTSWVNACTTLAAAITLSSAGDDFNILSTHAETSGSNITLTFKGTAASPNRVFSCGNTNSPATASDILAGASITCSASFGNIQLNGFVYIYGVSFRMGTGTNCGVASIGASASSRIVFDACSFSSLGTDATFDVILAGGAGTGGKASFYDFVNCTFVTNNVQNSIQITGGTVRFVGGTYFATGSIPTVMFRQSGGTPQPSTIIIDGADLSSLGSGKTLIGSPTVTQYYQFIKCKLGSSVTVASGITASGFRVDLITCDSGAVNYRNESYQYSGTLITSTSVYNLATDGVTPVSWQVVTTANNNRQNPFECFEITKNVAAGTYAASLVQITSATAGLTNADVWVEVEYLGSAGSPLSSKVTSGPATQLTTGSSLAAGTWATGGLGNNYKLVVPSFTTALAGDVTFRVKVAKTSLTVNIDPSVVVA